MTIPDARLATPGALLTIPGALLTIPGALLNPRRPKAGCRIYARSAPRGNRAFFSSASSPLLCFGQGVLLRPADGPTVSYPLRNGPPGENKVLYFTFPGWGMLGITRLNSCYASSGCQAAVAIWWRGPLSFLSFCLSFLSFLPFKEGRKGRKDRRKGSSESPSTIWPPPLGTRTKRAKRNN